MVDTVVATNGGHRVEHQWWTPTVTVGTVVDTNGGQPTVDTNRGHQRLTLVVGIVWTPMVDTVVNTVQWWTSRCTPMVDANGGHHGGHQWLLP